MDRLLQHLTMESDIDGDLRLEWFRFGAYEVNDPEIRMTVWGFIIRDPMGHIVHATMPRWWSHEQRSEVAQNLISLIQLRSNS